MTKKKNNKTNKRNKKNIKKSNTENLKKNLDKTSNKENDLSDNKKESVSGDDNLNHTHRHVRGCRVNKKVKNLTSISVLFAGLFAGSLFVDVAQFVKGEGFSSKAIKNADVLEIDGNTWVKYNEPKVLLDVVVSDDCGEVCENIDNALLGLKSDIPTLQARKINISKPEYKDYVSEYEIDSLPAFVFDKNLTKTKLYKQIKSAGILKEKNGKYILDLSEIDVETIKLDNTSDKKDINKPEVKDNNENESLSIST